MSPQGSVWQAPCQRNTAPWPALFRPLRPDLWRGNDGRHHGEPQNRQAEQEFILGFAGEVEEVNNVAAIAVDTDGTDGPTQIAGGIIDGETLKRAKELGIDIKKY